MCFIEFKVKKEKSVCMMDLQKTRQSTKAGWGRGMDKYSPSKEVNLSPLKHAQANLSGYIHEQYLDVFLWVVNMSEQFYYDNAFLVLSYSKKDEQKMALILHRAFVGVDMKFFNNLDEVRLLGAGAFGSLYSCRDEKSNLKFAVKHILGDYQSFANHFENLLSYMSERNANIRAMSSPFIIRFYYSLQYASTGDFFLFFEFCIGDLSKYINGISTQHLQVISDHLYHNTKNIIDSIYRTRSDLLEVSILYVFEIFCGLDFLVKCNIIHQDIKPENIMVSSNLHLKIGDFGLAYKTRTIHRSTNVYLLNLNRVKDYEEWNYSTSIGGTLTYQDLEIQLMFLKKRQPDVYMEVLNDESHGLSNDDLVILKDIDGVPELNGKECEVTVLSRSSLRLRLDTSKYGKHIKNGICSQKKRPKILKFGNFYDQSFKPTIINPDFCRLEFSRCIQVLYLALKKLQLKSKRMPLERNDVDYLSITEICLRCNNVNINVNGSDWLISMADLFSLNNPVITGYPLPDSDMTMFLHSTNCAIDLCFSPLLMSVFVLLNKVELGMNLSTTESYYLASEMGFNGSQLFTRTHDAVPGGTCIEPFIGVKNLGKVPPGHGFLVDGQRTTGWVSCQRRDGFGSAIMLKDFETNCRVKLSLTSAGGSSEVPWLDQ